MLNGRLQWAQLVARIRPFPNNENNMASKRELLKTAMEEVRTGKPRQEVFAAYRSHVNPEKHLACAIATVADPERMKQGAKHCWARSSGWLW